MADYSTHTRRIYEAGPDIRAAAPQAEALSAAEVMEWLDVSPSLLREWTAQFNQYLSSGAQSPHPRYTPKDVQLLDLARTLLSEGSDMEQVHQYLYSLRVAPGAPESTSLMASGSGEIPGQSIQDVLRTVADAHHTLLNSQAANRELIGVIVQDNFNLKDENRKLRERMLDLERTLAEFQRREENRNERLESRLRALEGALSALQQQIAHLVHRARSRRSWFW